MKVVIPGGSGHIGRLLADEFISRGDQVVILSRDVPTSLRDLYKGKRFAKIAQLEFDKWDARSKGDWMRHFDDADLVINLAGRSVNCRYNVENKRVITESRVRSTQLVGTAIARAKNPPSVWMQMSTATLYEHRFDKANDEYDGIIGGSTGDAPATWRFSIDVVKAWEKAVDEADVPGTRKVKMRTSIVMSPSAGGAFEILLRLVRLGLGGTCGSGKQFISWISDLDFVRATLFVLEAQNIDGPVNFVSTGALPNAEFMRDLRQAWGTGIGLPATEWMLELGALLLQSETELILKSRRVAPAVLLKNGFEFKQPEWPEAAKDLCRRWREEQKK